ncbi:MAG: tRNA glutamyl-Q(34) synthetase GluQRS [Propionibacterium freudenreichii]
MNADAPVPTGAGDRSGAGRFAPSPTSQLHLGNLRTALLAWLFARAEGLRFLVRIEDLDQARVAAAPGVADQQLRDLAALGLDWDGPVLRQSGRIELYRSYADRLSSYECFCSRREIAEASAAPHGDYRPYPGTCAHLSAAQRAEARTRRTPALRVRAGGIAWTVHDRFAGDYSQRVDDFVLLRADGTPSYNLASVVDDALQGVRQVTRGADLLSSAPRQAWLTHRLGYVQPVYAHVGLVLNGAGVRLAKRDHPTDMTTLAAQGIDARRVLRMLTDSCGLPTAECPGELLAMVRADPGLLHRPALAQPCVLDAQDHLLRH